MKKMTLLVDTREKKPWKIKGFYSKRLKLDTGDYTIEGYEKIIRIERKASIAELHLNLIGHWDAFLASTKRLSKFPIHFLIITDTFSALQRQNRFSVVSPKVYLSRFNRLMLETGVTPLFIGKTRHGTEYVGSLLTKSVELWKASKTGSQVKKMKRFKKKMGIGD